MAYYINGKTYTDHPLMDEIVFNCKRILNGIVIKNDVLAIASETENSLQHAEMFFIQHDDGVIPFSVYPFTEEILVAFGYSQQKALGYLRDRNTIPEEDQVALTQFANKWFSDRFVEENDYYRSLMGLPPFDSGKDYYVYISKEDLPSSYTDLVDFSLPIHEQPESLITILYSVGTIAKLRKKYIGSKYSYIDHLGYRSIDLYTARKAGKWDILYMPNVQYLVRDRFTEIYKINRDIYIDSFYQEFYAQNSDYYNQEMIVMLVAETFNDLIAEVPEWYIRRDIFDIRSCQYFLESNGVDFYKQIPLKYQIRIVKNLNRLIRYKSSNKNFEDIIDIFKVDATINKYWLYKRRATDGNGKYIDGKTDDEKFKLQFIGSDMNDSYDDYIKDPINITNYDEITYLDKYWDGVDDHDYIAHKIVNKQFTIQGTKYKSIELHISFKEYTRQIEYFLGLILDSHISTNDVLIPIPSIDEFAEFKLSSLFLFLVVLTNSYFGTKEGDDSNKIRYPDSMSEYEGPIKIPEAEDPSFDWKKKTMPEIYGIKNGRINSFNPKFNKEKMEEFIKERRHSHFLFGASYNNPDNVTPNIDRPLTNAEYAQRAIVAMDELGITDFIVPNGEFNTIDDIVGVYENDCKCYDILSNAIKNADNQDDKKVLQYIFQEMYTREYDKEMYLLKDGTYAKDLTQILKEKDFILWNAYHNIITESNIETRQDLIRSIMNDVIDTLEYYLKFDCLNYIFSFTAIQSFSAIVHYIYLMVKFFKSFKVHFIDPYVTYEIDDDMLENYSPIDNINGKQIVYNGKNDKQFTSDAYGMNVDIEVGPDEAYTDNAKEEMEVFGFFEPDPYDDMDYNGMNAEQGQGTDYKDINGGLATDISTYPYIMVNGGTSSGGKINLHDFNGGDADDRYHDYADVDGGLAFTPDDERKDFLGTEFTYDIDGAGAAPRSWRTGMMNTYIGWRYKNKHYFPDKDPSDSDKKDDTEKTDPEKIVDDGVYNYGEAELFDETAKGDYDFGSLDNGTDSDTVAKGDYDFEILKSDKGDDDGVYNFGDVEEGDETAEGDYDFGSLEEGIAKDSVAVSIDFNIACNDNSGEDDKPDYGLELVADIILSSLPNGMKVVIEEDGIYIKDIFANYEDFKNQKNACIDDMDYFYKVDFEAIEQDIALLSDIDRLRKRINTCLDEYLEPFYYVLDKLDGDKFKVSLVQIVDNQVDRLNTKYNNELLNVFAWEDLDDLGGNL